MKTYTIASLLSVVGLFGFTACTTPPPAPEVLYPVSYQIQVGNTQVRADDGPQNLNVSATQDVAAIPNKTLFYQVESPVQVNVEIHEMYSDGTYRQIGQMQGTTFTASVDPTSRKLRFTFAAAQANSGGTLRFTLSDRPIAPAVRQM